MPLLEDVVAALEKEKLQLSVAELLQTLNLQQLSTLDGGIMLTTLLGHKFSIKNEQVVPGQPPQIRAKCTDWTGKAYFGGRLARAELMAHLKSVNVATTLRSI